MMHVYVHVCMHGPNYIVYLTVRWDFGVCVLYQPLPCSGKVIIYLVVHCNVALCIWPFIWEVYAKLIACEPGEGPLCTRD